MKLGVHVSIAGHIYEAVDRAASLGCNTFQIFSRNPRGWEALALVPADVEEFKKRRKEKKISPVVVHIPYLINLCSGDDALWRRSVDAYIEDIKRADTLGADYFVTHLGSPKDKGRDYGIERFSKGMVEAVTRVKSRLSGTKQGLMILLENTAGGGDSIGSKFEDIAEIIKNVRAKTGVDVGMCLDTAHTFEAGFDDSTGEGLEATLKKIDSTVGLGKIKVVHFNDSLSEMGSHNDRHWHIGKGKIGAGGMKRIINHPKLRGCAFILETPKETEDADKKNLAAVRKMRKD
ncbi:MAG: deoxyribonuclease IV [Candidatus Omnitrophota bacterium]|jgi:deoxyribonuclease-4